MLCMVCMIVSHQANNPESCLWYGRMGGRPLNVAFAEPKQIEQQQQPAQPKVSIGASSGHC